MSKSCRTCFIACSGVPRRGLGGLEPLPLSYDLRNTRIKIWYFQQKYEQFSGKGAETLSPMGRGIPPHPPHPSHPPQRLRRLDPSHSKILGTPLIACFILLVNAMTYCALTVAVPVPRSGAGKTQVRSSWVQHPVRVH